MLHLRRMLKTSTDNGAKQFWFQQKILKARGVDTNIVASTKGFEREELDSSNKPMRYCVGEWVMIQKRKRIDRPKEKGNGFRWLPDLDESPVPFSRLFCGAPPLIRIHCSFANRSKISYSLFGLLGIVFLVTGNVGDLL